MKKLFFLLTFLLSACLIVIGQSTVKTPTNVSVEVWDDTEWDGWVAIWEARAAQWIIDNGLTNYAIRIGPATHTYNCHDYAWHYSDGGSPDWMNQLDFYNEPNVPKYWQGSNFTYTTTTQANATKFFMPEFPDGDHSMIKSSTYAGWYESKWGPWPKYRHLYTAHPYDMTNIEFYKLDISGNNFTCSSSNNTYSTKNISSANYTWSADYLSISGSGYSVTGTGSGNGQGIVRVAISSPYSGTTVRGTIPVWVGTPLPSVTGPTEGSVGNSYTYYVNTTSEMQAYSNYDWSLSPYYDGNAIYDYEYWASANFYAQQEGSFQISASAQNTCGTGYGTTYIWISYYGDYSLYPNPASSEVAITLINAEQNQDLSNAVHEVSIYNMYGVLQSNHKYSGERFTMPVYNLKNGTYIIKIDNGKSVVNKQLIIKH